MVHRKNSDSLCACGAAEQVDLRHSSQLRDVFDSRGNVGCGRMGVYPVICRFLGMTVAVNVDGPDVVTVLRQKVHQGLVADLQVVKGATRPLASMDKERNFACAGEGFLIVFLVFFPQIDAQAVPHHVVFFPLDRSCASTTDL